MASCRAEQRSIGPQFVLPKIDDSLMYQEPIAKDRLLLQELVRLQLPKKIYYTAGLNFRNPSLAIFAENEYLRQSQIEIINGFLQRSGALRYNLMEEMVEVSPGEFKQVLLIGATDCQTKNEMAQAFWIRDQAQTAIANLNQFKTNRNRFADQGKLGRELLLSSLTLMSTRWQLERFRAIIKNSNDTAFVNNPKNWPHIFMHFENLNGKKTENWSHKQDAWQMVAWATFEAIESGLIYPYELTDRHIEFLGSIAPFLSATDFITRENSGSWEEIEARKTSTLAWNVALLKKINDFSSRPGFEFLKSDLDIGKMIEDGLMEIVKREFNESADYPKNSCCYRETDAALLYLLDLGVPQMIVDKKSGLSEEEKQGEIFKLEMEILNRVDSLTDSRTHGIRRYGHGGPRDSYQGPNFGLNTTAKKLIEMYKSPTGDFSGRANFIGRDKIVEPGEMASWVHFNPQISAWASRRFLESADKRYLPIATQYLNRTLALVTGDDEFYIRQINGQLVVANTPAMRIPECYVTYQLENDGRSIEIITASPHTPLNWAVAKTQEALNLYSVGLS